MNIEKYKNNGWGLSKQCFLDVKKCLDNIKSPVIVEFGSGISTIFFVDYLKSTKKDGVIYSFDNNKEYIPEIKYNKLNLFIKELIEFDDLNYNNMFINKEYSSNGKIRIKEPNTKQKNCFYNIKTNELPEKIDLVLIDGPHGNGRNISFLHLLDRLHENSYVIIDDFNHYDFCEKFVYLFPNNKLIYESNTGKRNQWELGGNYRIYKIL